MIYLFAGDDINKKISNYQKFVDSLPKGPSLNPQETTEIFFIINNNFDFMQIESFFSGPSFFSDKQIIVFKNIFENEKILNFILEKLNLMSTSQNDFIFLEGKLNKATLDLFKKARAELNIFELSKMQKEKFDNFLLANDFGQRNKLNLWIHFRQAVEKGVMLEELSGVLFWKIKTMILSKSQLNATDIGQKFSEIELKNYATKLSYLLPEARKSGLDAEIAFEKFLLEI